MQCVRHHLPFLSYQSLLACSLMTSTQAVASGKKLHFKCRNSEYPREKSIQRFPVPDDKVDWAVKFDEYKPVEFTHAKVLAKPVWADPDIPPGGSDTHGIKFNTIDNKVDRKSFMGTYEIVDGRPRNPMGRTGIQGRAALGRWGPNHAADPIVTRWKRDKDGNVVKSPADNKPILQFVSILRGDIHQWAIPGGMVDPGEAISSTLMREFSEEALSSITADDEKKALLKAQVEANFQKFEEVYAGYVDDPRNTDNAWMETVARNFHDETGKGVGQFELVAGDDAVGVQWTDMSKELSLYASHRDFVEIVAHKHNAHW